MDLAGAAIAILVGVFVIVGLLAFARVYNAKQAKDTIDLLNLGLAAERDAREREQLDCRKSIDELRGQVNGMRGDFAKDLVREVLRELRAENGDLAKEIVREVVKELKAKNDA